MLKLDIMEVMKSKSISAIEVSKLLLSFDQGREYFCDGKMTVRKEEETDPPTIGAVVYPVYKNFFSLYRELLKTEEINVDSERKNFVRRLEEDDDRMIINEEVKNFYHDILGHIVREVELNEEKKMLILFPLTSNHNQQNANFVSQNKITAPRPPCLQSEFYPNSFVNTNRLVMVSHKDFSYLKSC
ncbi:7384_t:CDS:2 [Entrophospora sp. SA101]|nr:2550_t:CDS:2 [Entrophospora sp. SA101]CAJ0888789.1 7384_t:CDS:2 [Entrophospora sp. SA101]